MILDPQIATLSALVALAILCTFLLALVSCVLFVILRLLKDCESLQALCPGVRICINAGMSLSLSCNAAILSAADLHEFTQAVKATSNPNIKLSALDLSERLEQFIVEGI